MDRVRDIVFDVVADKVIELVSVHVPDHDGVLKLTVVVSVRVIDGVGGGVTVTVVVIDCERDKDVEVDPLSVHESDGVKVLVAETSALKDSEEVEEVVNDAVLVEDVLRDVERVKELLGVTVPPDIVLVRVIVPDKVSVSPLIVNVKVRLTVRVGGGVLVRVKVMD
jgi:hypothetical protein